MRRKSYRKSVRKQRKRGGSSQKKDKIDLKKYVVLKQTDVNLLYDITKKTIDILDKANIDYWAEGGTLIGIMRSKGFIPWDDDVDISMDIKDKPRLMQLKGDFKKIKLELVGVGRYVKVKSPHNKKVWIDIFFLDNGIYPQKHYEIYNYDMLDDELYPLKKGKFGPFKMKIANKSGKYLDRCYKDWRKIAFIYNHHTKNKIKVSFKDYPLLKKPKLPT